MCPNQHPCHPVSRAINIPEDKLRTKLEQAIEALKLVSECIGLVYIPVREEKIPGDHSAAFRYDFFDEKANYIAISPYLDPAKDWPLMACIHEVGHHIDYHATGVSGHYLSEAPDGDDWYEKVCASSTFQNLSGILQIPPDAKGTIPHPGGAKVRSKILRDSLTRHELFAHSFVFYVAMKSENRPLLQELNRFGNNLQERAHFPFWGNTPCDRRSIESHFGNIASEIEQILEKPKWTI